MDCHTDLKFLHQRAMLAVAQAKGFLGLALRGDVGELRDDGSFPVVAIEVEDLLAAEPKLSVFGVAERILPSNGLAPRAPCLYVQIFFLIVRRDSSTPELAGFLGRQHVRNAENFAG